MAGVFELNGESLGVPDGLERAGLLEVLRHAGRVRSAKDGCAPQGQCGCCTVLVDGKARVACVTPVSRVLGRSVVTLEGLESSVAAGWAREFVAHGATQCGFCTPGIIMRLEERRLRAPGGAQVPPAAVERALAAHLCRCTGWQGITEVGVEVLGRGGFADRPRAPVTSDDADQAALRATLEGRTPQRVEPDMCLGKAAFAADEVPTDALVAVPGPSGDWIVRETLAAARAAAEKVQGRRSSLQPAPPLDVPDGAWAATLSTCWTEPAYLETDCSWCEPGGRPATPLANGGAFGAKAASPLPSEARRLADETGRTVVVFWSREDTVRHGPKRPPVAIGAEADGSGTARVVATPGIGDLITAVAPDLEVRQREVAGPATAHGFRAAGWAEAFCALVAAGATSPAGGVNGDAVRVVSPTGGWAAVRVDAAGGGGRGALRIDVGAGDPLDEAVLRSYVIGSAHMAASMVCSEGLAVDPTGEPQDLTIRSFGILPASAMPHVDVRVDPAGGEPVAVSEAVFAATAAAVWRHHGFPPVWPIGRPVIEVRDAL